MYEFLTLEPVFAGDDRHRLLRRIMEDEPRSLRALDPRIPLELETIVLKAMAKAPSDRYLTAGQFADDLHRPPPPEHRPPRSGRRPPPRDHAAHEMRTQMHDEVERLLSLLTDEQRQAWRELIGKPFRLDPHGPEGRQR